MTNNNNRSSSVAEYSTHFAIEDTTDSSTRLALDVDTFLIECDMTFYIGNVVGTKVVNDTIASCDRHRQAPPIALEITAQLTVF